MRVMHCKSGTRLPAWPCAYRRTQVDTACEIRKCVDPSIHASLTSVHTCRYDAYDGFDEEDVAVDLFTSRYLVEFEAHYVFAEGKEERAHGDGDAREYQHDHEGEGGAERGPPREDSQRHEASHESEQRPPRKDQRGVAGQGQVLLPLR